MKINRSELIVNLKDQINRTTADVVSFRSLSPDRLNYKKTTESWSILECLEHLNRYGDFYLVEIEKQILTAPKSPQALVFNSGILGNYFAEMMLPKNGRVKKMKTFKKMDPANSNLPITVLEKFLKQQERMLSLLEMAGEVDLTRITTGITLTSWLRFRLGDTFRFTINHIERHVEQAKRVRG